MFMLVICLLCYSLLFSTMTHIAEMRAFWRDSYWWENFLMLSSTIAGPVGLVMLIFS